MDTEKIRITASAIIPYTLNEKSGIIYVKTKKDGKWGLPAGKIDLFEDIHSAMSREMAEETGLEIILEKYIGIWDFKSERGSAVSNRVFSGRVVEGELITNEPEKILDIKVLTLKEIRMLFRKGKIRAGRANVEPVEEYLRGVSYPLSSNHTLF